MRDSPCPFTDEGFFLSYRKLRLLYDKNAPRGCAARGEEGCLTAPLAREECAKRILFYGWLNGSRGGTIDG